MIAEYTDGTPVGEGDSIRYHQAPGGMLPASTEWTYGTARKFPHTPEQLERMEAYRLAQAAKGYGTMSDPDTLYLFTIVHPDTPQERPAYYGIVGGHIVERVALDQIPDSTKEGTR